MDLLFPLLPLALKTILSSVAVFLGIRIWVKVRDSVWVHLFLSSLGFFLGAIFELLELVGFFQYEWSVFGDLPVIKMLLSGLPLFFMILAFLMMILKYRRY